MEFIFSWSEFGIHVPKTGTSHFWWMDFIICWFFKIWNNLSVPCPRKMPNKRNESTRRKSSKSQIKFFDLFIACDVLRSAWWEKIEWISVLWQINNADTSLKWNEENGEWRKCRRRTKVRREKHRIIALMLLNAMNVSSAPRKWHSLWLVSAALFLGTEFFFQLFIFWIIQFGIRCVGCV